MLTKEQILTADDLKPVPVEVPEWGGTVYVRPMSGAERSAYEKQLGGKGDSWYPLLVAITACDEAGGPLFTAEDAEALAGKNARVLFRVALASARLNKLDTAGIEDAEKN